MPRLTERQPDWPADDWERYFRNTWVLSPVTNEPDVVIGVNSAGMVLQKSSQTTTPFSEFTWAHLKHPRLGWALCDNGLPIYVVKKPAREVVKGLRRQILTAITPPHIDLCLQHIGWPPAPNWCIQRLTLSSLFSTPNVPLHKAAAQLNDSALAVVMTRELLLTHNPDPQESREFPFLLACGPALAGKVRADLSIEQVGDVDLSEVLYANAA